MGKVAVLQATLKQPAVSKLPLVYGSLRDMEELTKPMSSWGSKSFSLLNVAHMPRIWYTHLGRPGPCSWALVPILLARL